MFPCCPFFINLYHNVSLYNTELYNINALQTVPVFYLTRAQYALYVHVVIHALSCLLLSKLAEKCPTKIGIIFFAGIICLTSSDSVVPILCTLKTSSGVLLTLRVC